MAVNKVVYGGNTLIDLTSDTATASDVAQGKTFHLADGTQATGTASGGGGDEDPCPVRNDGKLHIWVRVHENNKHVIICGLVSYNPAGTIDWGDGTTDTVTTSSPNDIRQGLPHDYAEAGLYEIVFNPISNRQLRLSVVTMMGKKGTASGNIGNYASDGALAYTGQLVAIEFPKYSSGPYSGIGGINVLAGCTNLEKVTLPNNTSMKFSGISNIYQDSNMEAIIYLKSLREFSVQQGGTVNFLTNAFAGCVSLKSIDVSMATSSSSFTHMFDGCESLTTVILPSNISVVGAYMFHMCVSLQEIELPNGISQLGAYSFSDCWQLRSLSIPSGVTTIGENVFANCYSLTDLHVQPETPPTLGTDAFTGTPSNMVIYVPSASLEAYQTAENWSTYASQMVGE